MWSGGCERSPAKQLDNLLSSVAMVQSRSNWTISFLPADIMWKSPRVEAYQEGEADETRQLKIDSVEEARINALTQSARYLQGVRRYHDRNVQQRSFNIGDLVLCRIQDETGLHKLNSRWEGPFIVTKVTRPGSYRITDADGNEVLNS